MMGFHLLFGGLFYIILSAANNERGTVMGKKYLINEVAQKLGISAAAIRLYEKKGLFTSKKDPENGYRYFDEADVYKIWSVAYHRSYDLGINEIDELKHSDSLWDIRRFFSEQKKKSQAMIEREQQRIKLFDFYTSYVDNSLRYGEPPCEYVTEPLHFYDKEDIYTRSGPAFPGASFCYIFRDVNAEPEMYSLIYHRNHHMVSEINKNREIFTAEPFVCMDVIIELDFAMDEELALKKALKKADEFDFSVKPPYYISYLLSCGKLDASKSYYEAMLPLA